MRNVKWNLAWDEKQCWLSWGPLCLVYVEPIQTSCGPHLKLIAAVFEDVLLDESDNSVFIQWEDMENCDGDYEYLIADNGTAHDRLKEIYARVLNRGGFEIEGCSQSLLFRVWNRLRSFFGK